MSKAEGDPRGRHDSVDTIDSRIVDQKEVRPGEEKTIFSRRFTTESEYVRRLCITRPDYIGALVRFIGPSVVEQALTYYLDGKPADTVSLEVGLFSCTVQNYRPQSLRLPKVPEQAFSISSQKTLRQYDHIHDRSTATYFSGCINPDFLPFIDQHDDKKSLLYKREQRGVLTRYKKEEYRNKKEILRELIPMSLEFMEQYFFQGIPIENLAKTHKKPPREIVEAINDGLYAFDIRKPPRNFPKVRGQNHERIVLIVNQWGRIQETIRSLPNDIRNYARELLKGRSVLSLSKETGVNQHQLQSLKQRLLYGDQGTVNAPFIIEQEREAIRKVRKIPFTQQSITQLTQKVIEGKIKKIKSVDLGEDRDLPNKKQIHVLLKYFMQDLYDAFPEARKTIVQLQMRKSFKFNDSVWGWFSYMHRQLIVKMKNEKRSVTPSQELLLQNALALRISSEEEGDMLRFLLGRVKARRKRKEDRKTIIDEFMKEHNMRVIFSAKEQEVILALHRGEAYKDIHRKYGVGIEYCLSLMRRISTTLAQKV